MANTNYIGGIVKILEAPKQKFIKNRILVTKFRAQLPQIRKTTIVNLVFWGNLGRDVKDYYKINDYIFLEGYISLRPTNQQSLNSMIQKSKKVEITVLKVYPFLLTYNRSPAKI